jgi:hypothetical protein
MPRYFEHLSPKQRFINFLRREIMSQLTDQMTAALTTLEAKLSASGVTTDEVTTQIHSVVDPMVADLNSKFTAITSSEADDATKIADLTAAVSEFTTAFAPATPVAETPAAPAPAAVAETPAA